MRRERVTVDNSYVVGNACGIYFASLWKSMMEPFDRFLFCTTVLIS